MRRSSVMRPSCSGTLKSTRMSTRRPATSVSARVRLATGRPVAEGLCEGPEIVGSVGSVVGLAASLDAFMGAFVRSLAGGDPADGARVADGPS